MNELNTFIRQSGLPSQDIDYLIFKCENDEIFRKQVLDIYNAHNSGRDVGLDWERLANDIKAFREGSGEGYVSYRRKK